MGRLFPTTRWSVVLDAAQGAQAPRKALRELCEAYWRPLYVFVRRDGRSPEDAEDAVQGFLSTLLAGPAIAGLDPELGRFRSYLLGALRNYLAGERRRERALKRGGQHQRVSLTIDREHAEGGLEIPAGQTPEGAYAYAWAMEILGRTRARLGAQYAEDGREALFEALEPFLRSGDAPRYRQVASELGMTEANARVAVHRLRIRFRAALREEVAQTVSSDAQIDDELRAVIEAIRT